MSIATRVRQSPSLPSVIAAELSGKSDAQIDAAWLAASSAIGQGQSVDDAVKAVEGTGWSYDAAYWFANQTRLYGSEGYVKPRSYRILSRSIFAALILACILWQSRDGRVSTESIAAGLGAATVYILLIVIVVPRELRRHL
ncbi:MAG: hypothetical protein ACO1SV_09740 [Fimbriimonas sp.]